MDESTEETQARQAAALSGEIDQEVGENGVLVSGGGADARVLRSQEAPDAGAFRTPVAVLMRFLMQVLRDVAARA